jgi:hypothetical protein
MTREEFEAFVKKHTFAIVAIGGGAAITLVIVLRSRGNSGAKSNLDTIHTDLGQIDFDLNQIDTNMSATNSWTSNLGSPDASTASDGVTPAQLDSSTKQIIDLINSKHIATQLGEIDADVDALSSKKSTSTSKPSGSVGTTQTKTNKPVPAMKVPVSKVSGKGPEGAYIPDGPTDAWAMVGVSDLIAIYDTWHQTEAYSLPGDYNDFANLN